LIDMRVGRRSIGLGVLAATDQPPRPLSFGIEFDILQALLRQARAHVVEVEAELTSLVAAALLVFVGLAQPRDAAALRTDVLAMRAKMRAELDRSDAARLDLKQGAGGLVDLEFLLQYLVLRDAPLQPSLRLARDTPGLLAALCDAGVFTDAACKRLREAHALLLDAGLRCTLDRRPRIVAPGEDIVAACATIAAACRDNGLVFAGPDAA